MDQQEFIVPIVQYSVIIKKMRLLKNLNRQQAACLFHFSDKLIERYENGRSRVTPEKFRLFAEKYDFSNDQIQKIARGEIFVSEDANIIRKKITDSKRKNKRFNHRQISRHCKVLKELRIRLNIDQYTASKRCGYGRNKIGFIENGRITLTDEVIKHIVFSYGLTMELFNQLLKINPLPHEMIEEAQQIISGLGENKLLAILPMLRSLK